MAANRITTYTSSSGAVLQLSSPSKSKRPDWKITAIGSLLLVVLGFAAWKLWPSRPSPTAPPAKLVRFIASDDFALMKPDEKQVYVDAIQKVGMRDLFRAANDAKLTDDERANGMENFMTARWNKSLNEYFALPLGTDRDAFLDKMIDEQQARMAAWQQRAATRPTTGPTTRPGGGGMRFGGGGGGAGGAGGGRGGPGGGRGMDPTRQARRIELTPPGQRAQMAEFMAQMRARRQARGLPNRGPGMR